MITSLFMKQNLFDKDLLYCDQVIVFEYEVKKFD